MVAVYVIKNSFLLHSLHLADPLPRQVKGVKSPKVKYIFFIFFTFFLNK